MTGVSATALLALAIFLAALLVVFAALIGAAGIALLAVAARVWSDALAAAHVARARRAQADAEEETIEEARAALRAPHADAPAPPRPSVTDEDLLRAVVAERDDRDFNTTTNEGVEIEPPIPPGGMYRTAHDAYAHVGNGYPG